MPEMMKAVMGIEPGKLGIGELEIPRPGEYEALVKMEACAVCNSTDHKLLTNEFFSGAFPIALGHEVISTVVDAGPKVENFRVGDRVFRQRLYDSHVPGGRSCWGGFAEYGIVVDEWARQGLAYGPESLPHDQQKLMIDVAPELAAGMITLMECLDCIRSCGAAPGKSVAVVGSGPVGQALAMFAKLLGAGPVYAFGRDPARAERFENVCGVDGYVSGECRATFDVAVEAVGSVDALDRCIELAGQAGRVFVYGIAPGSSPYRPDQMSRDNVSTVGAVEGRAQAALVRWIEEGKVNLSDWVSHVLPLEDYQYAFDLVKGKQALKAVLLGDRPEVCAAPFTEREAAMALLH